MGKEISTPNVEIIENGVPVSGERMDPNVAAFIMQAAATAQLVKLRKLEESKIPIGAPTFEWEITTTVKKIVLDNPWISFTLINDGAGNVRLRINNREGNMSNETTIDSGETINRHFTYPIVNMLFLVTESGTATVRIYAEEGKWR